LQTKLFSFGEYIFLPCHQNNKFFFVHVKRCSVSHWPPASEIGMLLINFVELRRTSWNSAWLPEKAERGKVSHSTSLCRGLEINGMVGDGLRGMTSANQTWPHCVNQMGKTHSKNLAVLYGMGTAWARHATCESAFLIQPYYK